MKYARILRNGSPVYGLVEGEHILPIEGSIYGAFRETGDRLPLAGASFLPPSEPTKIVAVGKNYLDHIKEFDGDIPKNPIIFLKPVSALIAHGEAIVCPPSSARVDYEGELCLIIKKRAKNVRASEAAGYISGYTCMNDVTARDLQALDGQWTRAKGFDTFAPAGPIVSDELDPDCADIRTLVNREVKQEASTRLFIWKVGALLEFITAVMTLEPGDMVTTGTPSGVGPLAPGDVVEVEIAGIGTLRNTVM